jgi:hypothetical protein
MRSLDEAESIIQTAFKLFIKINLYVFVLQMNLQVRVQINLQIHLSRCGIQQHSKKTWRKPPKPA